MKHADTAGASGVGSVIHPPGQEPVGNGRIGSIWGCFVVKWAYKTLPVAARSALLIALGHSVLILAAGAQSPPTPPPEAKTGSIVGWVQSTPFVSDTEGYRTFRIPAITVNGAGQLLAICEGRKRGSSDAGDIDTVFKLSENGGRTWGKLGVIWDDSTNTCGNPCVVRDAETGFIWLLNTWNRGEDHEQQIINQTSKDTRRVFVSRSSNDGRTWSSAREITADVKRTNWTWYATGPGAGIQLQRGPHQGRLVVPCDHIEAGTKRYYSHVIYSDDHGQAWKLGGTTPRDQVNECEVVELADGALRLNMRSYDSARKARQSAISRDGGSTWEEQQIVPELLDPICQASIRRLAWPQAGKPGVILFANAASERRERMTVRASFDDGRTWSVSRRLSAQPAAYSCLVAMPNGSIGLLYESGPQHPYQAIVFSSFTLDWLKAGAGL
jgi:sialidase-1